MKNAAKMPVIIAVGVLLAAAVISCTEPCLNGGKCSRSSNCGDWDRCGTVKFDGGACDCALNQGVGKTAR